MTKMHEANDSISPLATSPYILLARTDKKVAALVCFLQVTDLHRYRESNAWPKNAVQMCDRKKHFPGKHYSTSPPVALKV
jgi:phosphatidylserine decarboxylase